jgi:hypothetical protein
MFTDGVPICCKYGFCCSGMNVAIFDLHFGHPFFTSFSPSTKAPKWNDLVGPAGTDGLGRTGCCVTCGSKESTGLSARLSYELDASLRQARAIVGSNQGVSAQRDGIETTRTGCLSFQAKLAITVIMPRQSTHARSLSIARYRS